MPSIKSRSSFPCLYDDFSSMLDDFGLVQMVNEHTRCGNVLNLFFTSNHTLVQKVEIVPSIADHDIMIAETSNSTAKA